MLESQPVNARDIDTLLDWFDKVRTGLWLGFLYLNGNLREINPNYYITSRIATRDRALFVYRDAERRTLLSFAGPESPIFQVMPTCVFLRVNHLHFFNASTQDLVAERIGLPHLRNRRLVPDRKGVTGNFKEGTGRLSLPPVPFRVYRGGTQLFQSIIPPEAREDGSIMKTYYDNEFVRSSCMSWATGRSFVFQMHGATLRPYPATASRDWIPPVHTSGATLSLALGLLNAEWLEAMYSDLPSMDDLPKEQLDYINNSSVGIRKLHALMTEHAREQLTSFMKERPEPRRS